MYRDDGFILFNGSPDEIKEFFELLSPIFEIHIWNITPVSIPDSQRLNIRSYIKPTNSFQYLHRQSAHGPSVFKDWIRG